MPHHQRIFEDMKIEPRGKLIIVEGIDGSGKSTQIHLLEKWLAYKGVSVFKSEWNSSEMVKEITSKGKKKGLLTPTTFSLLHATDFADRYVYTAFVRDIVRGCNPEWVKKVYDFAIKPDVAFYFKVPVDIAVDRILIGRPKLKYYEAGMDMNLSNDAYESYRIFQGRIIEQYDALAEREGFTVIDGTLNIEEQQNIVRKKILPLLEGYQTSKMRTRR